MLMGITTAFIWGLFIFVINMINPTATNWLGFLIFYLSLFLAFAGTATIVGFLIRFKLLKHDLIFNSVKTAFRQSFLFAFLVVAILYLISEKLFSWTNLALLVIILSVAEFLMISYKK
jgi:hypothetical protein